MSSAELTRVTQALARALSEDDVNQLGIDAGQSERLRTVTPFRLFLSIVAGLASGKVESLADLLREFNHQNGVAVAYKAFYNRLARAGFAQFMRQMLARLIERLCVQTLTPTGHTAIARFKDIVIQDGSSFALKKQLLDVFPGRFTTTEPAAVEIHATYSGFSDEVSVVEIAPDCKALLGAGPSWWLLIQQFLNPAQRSAQSLRIGPGAAQLQRGSSSAAMGSATACSGSAASRCVPLRSTALGEPSTRRSARDSTIGASRSASSVEFDSRRLHFNFNYLVHISVDAATTLPRALA